jgi:hypothetical protein
VIQFIAAEYAAMLEGMLLERISGAFRAKRGGKRETPEERESYGMKILVVDDDRELVDLLTYCLRGFGYEVVRMASKFVGA